METVRQYHVIKVGDLYVKGEFDRRGVFYRDEGVELESASRYDFRFEAERIAELIPDAQVLAVLVSIEVAS